MKIMWYLNIFDYMYWWVQRKIYGDSIYINYHKLIISQRNNHDFHCFSKWLWLNMELLQTMMLNQHLQSCLVSTPRYPKYKKGNLTATVKTNDEPSNFLLISFRHSMDLLEENQTRRWNIHQFIEDFLMKTYMFRIFQPRLITAGYYDSPFQMDFGQHIFWTIFWTHFLERSSGLLHISSGIPASSMGFKVASISCFREKTSGDVRSFCIPWMHPSPMWLVPSGYDVYSLPWYRWPIEIDVYLWKKWWFSMANC